MNIDQHKIDGCIEKICKLGCRDVLEIIEKVKQDSAIPQMENLNTLEKQMVANELMAIMDVYNNQCNLNP